MGCDSHVKDKRMMITIVTAASDNHARSMFNLIESVKTFAPHHRLVVYDLGLHKYPYEGAVPYKGPAWHDVTRPSAGGYAWKPAIIREVANQYGGVVLWLDAGNLVHEPLELRVIPAIVEYGFYSPLSAGSVGDWTHPKTIAVIRPPKAVLTVQNRNGAIIGFDTTSSIGWHILDRWSRLCRDKDVITPEGSSRENHRQDQAVLSVLAAHAYVLRKLKLVDEQYSISTHNDVDE